MKNISSLFFVAPVFLAGCSPWGASETLVDDSPVLSRNVLLETRSSIDFVRHVKPILEARCVWCHDGTDSKMPYEMTSRKKAFEGGRIVPGNPGESLLYLAASGQHAALKMPAVGFRVPEEEAGVLKRWIQSGAVWPEGKAGHLKGR